MKSLLILLSLVSLASARIGETPAECTARYGEALDIDKEAGTISYSKAGFFIHATFHEGKVSQIFLMKIGEDQLGRSPEITDNEIEALLAANAGGGEWIKTQADNLMNKRWLNNDAARIAEFAAMENALVIMTLAEAERLAQAREAKEKAALEGF